MNFTKKTLIAIIGAIIGITLIIIIFVVIAKGDKKAREAKEEQNKIVEKEKVIDEEEKEEKEEKQEEEIPEEPKEKEEEKEEKKEEETPKVKKENRVSIDLKEKKQELKIEDSLRIVFAGTKENYGKNRYTYNADIYVNGNLVKNKLFNETNTRVIYSSNHGASFYVDKIDNVYIITSYIKKDADGYYAIFVNEKGEILREFNDVTMTIQDKKVMITVTTGNTEESKIHTNFEINGYDLNVIFEEKSNN